MSRRVQVSREFDTLLKEIQEEFDLNQEQASKIIALAFTVKPITLPKKSKTFFDL